MIIDNTRQERFFLWFLLLVSVALAWILAPYAGGCLWAVILAILFQPLYRRTLSLMPGRRSTAAGLTVVTIIVLIVVPTILIGKAVTEQIATIATELQGRDWRMSVILADIRDHLPQWANRMVDEYIRNNADQTSISGEAIANILSGAQNVSRWLLSIGQGALSFIIQCAVSLYVLFYLFMDDGEITNAVRDKGIFNPAIFDELASQFAAVVRGTVTGGILVAVIQGALGGVILWMLGFQTALLLALLMAIAALIPAVGTGLVWVPAALYLLITGDVTKAIILAVCGFFVIGAVDNILRPMLVGKSTKIPDFLILLTTLGGVDQLGPNGLVVGPMVAGLFLAAWETIGRTRTTVAAPVSTDAAT